MSAVRASVKRPREAVDGAESDKAAAAAQPTLKADSKRPKSGSKKHKKHKKHHKHKKHKHKHSSGGAGGGAGAGSSSSSSAAPKLSAAAVKALAAKLNKRQGAGDALSKLKLVQWDEARMKAWAATPRGGRNVVADTPFVPFKVPLSSL